MIGPSKSLLCTRRAAHRKDRPSSSLPSFVLSTLFRGHRSGVLRFLGVALLVASVATASAQGTASDYRRADQLRRDAEGKVFKARVTPHWSADGTRFWYRNDLAGGAREFVLVDAVAGTRQPAFDHAKVAAALSGVLKRDVLPTHLPIDGLVLRPDRKSLVLRVDGKAWLCDLAGYRLQPAADDAARARAADASLVPRRRAGPSRRTGEETSLTVVNKTAGEVRLFWIDSEDQRRPYGSIRAGGEHRQHTFAGHVWLVVDAKDKELAVFEATEEPARAIVEPDTGKRPAAKTANTGKTPPADARPRDRRRGQPAPEGKSPDGCWQAFIKDHNVHLRELVTGKQSQLSRDGTEQDAYGGGLHWSPDSKKLVVLRTAKGGDRKVYYVESSPKDQLQPKLHSYEYLKPGDPIPQPKPQLFDVAAGRQIPVPDTLFANPWSIEQVRWEADSSPFTFVYNQRGHQVLRVVAVDAATGKATAIVDEQSRTFIDYAHKQFLHWLDATGELIWMSERDGWNHLYLIDARTGRVKNAVTRGSWVVRGVDRVDAEKRQVWFRAGGIRPGQDPYYIHYARVNFDGTGLVVLTEGDGDHSVQFSPDGRWLIDTYSRVDLPPVSELRRATDGSLVCRLEEANISGLTALGVPRPERFAAKGRDGATDIYGVIYRPSRFDPAKKYPVIEEIYAGPQGAFVPKAFRPFYGPQSLAELGFILVQIDGMGTSHRSKAFHDVCWKNLGDSGFPDRIAWMKAAAARYPQMDLSRVGIYGGSAGGQSAARAVLAFGHFYKAAVADCGCHDNRMDKIWWNELWMGWPVGPHYAEQSNVTQAHRLAGKLLLIVGEKDENVDPASTMQVAAALVRADKDFELLVLPGAGHGSAESPYGVRRRRDFFVRHLLGVEPRATP